MDRRLLELAARLERMSIVLAGQGEGFWSHEMAGHAEHILHHKSAQLERLASHLNGRSPLGEAVYMANHQELSALFGRTGQIVAELRGKGLGA